MDRRLKTLAVVAMSLLSACSYKPLYGTTSGSNGQVPDQLAMIAIPEAESRAEQLVRNDLLSAMRPAGTAAENRYRLDLQIVERRTNIIDKQLPNTTRQAVKLSVAFSLLEGSKEVYSGKTFSQVSYDVIREPFADTQAETDALERAAHEVSGDIHTRLASYFATR